MKAVLSVIHRHLVYHAVNRNLCLGNSVGIGTNCCTEEVAVCLVLLHATVGKSNIDKIAVLVRYEKLIKNCSHIQELSSEAVSILDNILANFLSVLHNTIKFFHIPSFPVPFQARI